MHCDALTLSVGMHMGNTFPEESYCMECMDSWWPRLWKLRELHFLRVRYFHCALDLVAVSLTPESPRKVIWREKKPMERSLLTTCYTTLREELIPTLELTFKNHIYFACVCVCLRVCLRVCVCVP